MMLRIVVVLLTVLCALRPSVALAGGPEHEQQVIGLVNSIRADSGLAPLSICPELTASARRYAEYMGKASFFGHQGPDGSTLVSRNEGAGYTGWTIMAENLAAGQTDAQAVVRAWMDSPSHRANILSPQVREIGVGYVFRPGSVYGHYWVQEFGSRQGSPPRVAAPAQPPIRPAASAQPVLGASSKPRQLVPPSELRDAFGTLDTLGKARGPVVADPATGQLVQYYQRAVLEWHPENPPGYQVQRRLLGDLIYPGAEPPVPPTAAPPGPSHYFPFSPDKPTGLGHFVADFAPDGAPVYFKQFFDAHGGVRTFGYPKEEPRIRDGLWTQRFQAAVLEYHPEFDRDGTVPGTSVPYRAYRVQLELLGDKYAELHGVPAAK